MKKETKTELTLWALLIVFVGSMLLMFGCSNSKYTTHQKRNYKSEKYNPDNHWR